MSSYTRDVLPHLAAFLGGCVAWATVLAIGVSLFGPTDASGAPLALDQWPGRGVAAVSAVQILGFAAVATGLARLRGAIDLGLRRPDPWVTAWCLLGSLTVWTLPSWAASRWVASQGGDGGSLAWIGELLTTGPLPDRLAMVVAVCLVAPVAEEWIFRGWLWGLLRARQGVAVTLLVTSLLFAAYHLDPVQAVTLLPTAAFLGLARHLGGSLWVPVLAHFGNNAASAIVVTWASPALQDGMPWAVGVAGAAWTVVCCGLAWRRAHGESHR